MDEPQPSTQRENGSMSIWERYLTGKLTPADESLLPALLEDLEHEVRDATSEPRDDGGEPSALDAAQPLDQHAPSGIDIDIVLRELGC
jgi:hypothetical protein